MHSPGDIPVVLVHIPVGNWVDRLAVASGEGVVWVEVGEVWENV